ncbi:MAG: hypothetical protein OXE41_10325, partial [Gammaproteobacteria bacterium]|nr:hypothetical protein [Gammaproteobacteria bacterium]
MQHTLYHAILALALFTTTYAVNLQAPLYSVYAENSQVGATAITVAFAAYLKFRSSNCMISIRRLLYRKVFLIDDVRFELQHLCKK